LGQRYHHQQILQKQRISMLLIPAFLKETFKINLLDRMLSVSDNYTSFSPT
jgi:hypothetical protein